MKKQTQLKLAIITFIVMLATVIISYGQQAPNYKHPYLNASGQVLDEKENIIGEVTKDGIVKNGKGEVVGYIKGRDMTDVSGKKMGRVGKNGTFYDDKGAVVFTVDPKSKGERCKVSDPEGKVIAEGHESYKHQACAIHCLYRRQK